MTFIRRYPVVSFFGLAYGLSWAYWIPLALAGVWATVLLISELRRRPDTAEQADTV